MTGSIRVLHSMAAPDGTTRYSNHMAEGASPAVQPLFFTWRTAFTARYGVFHAHWPEYLLRGRGRQRPVKPLLYLVFLLKLRLTRTPIVRTVHNASPHDPGGRVEKVLLSLTDRWTDVFIRLNPTTVVPRAKGAAVTIPHGHYRDTFRRHDRAQRVPGRLLYFGIIKPYKGVDELVDVFAATPGDDLSLHLVGRADDPATAEQLRRAATANPRVELDLRFVPDDVLVREVTSCELVVLPHRELENSGTALVALSLGRPVLVHDTPTMRALAVEVGPPWVQILDGQLSPAALRHAWEVARDLGPEDLPALRNRDWDQVGLAHEAAYRRALQQRRGSTR